MLSPEETLKLENENLKIEVENLKLQINALKKIIFGSKRESTPELNEQLLDKQCSLFDESKNTNDNIDEQFEEQIDEKVEEITVYKKKNKKNKKAGIKKSALKDATIVKIQYVIDQDVNCPECNGELKEVGKEIVRQEIRFQPAKIELIEHIRHVYKCKNCGTKDGEKETNTFFKPQLPNPLLTHSFVSPSLATEVIYQKYYLGVPLYRQEKMWDDKGLVLPRNMMANWVIKIKEYYLEKIYELMFKELKASNKLAHVDETVMQCNKEPNRKASTNSYMWVYRSGELEETKGVIFNYSQSRSEKTAKEFLNGFKEILFTDGYAAYNNLENIIHAECWAHCRRYFYESIPLLDNKKMDTSATGYKGVVYCNKLFDIEREIAHLSEDEKKKIRLEKSKPIVDEFFNWVNSVMAEKIILNSKLKKALGYASNQRKELSEFLNNGKIPLTNSLAERAIRPFAVHRKNWLFADSVEGAKANAVMYSLIESAKVNKLNIYKYINYLLEQLPQLETPTEEELKKYLPWSQELPKEILNYEEEYEDLKIAQ